MSAINKEAARAHIKLNEGFRQFVYDDATGQPLRPGDTLKGNAAIGYGHDLIHTGIKEYQAEIFLADKTEEIWAAFTRELPWWTGRPDAAQIVMTDIAYQCGVTGLLGFKRMLACIHAGDWDGAARELNDSALEKQAPERTKRNVELLQNCKGADE